MRAGEYIADGWEVERPARGVVVASGVACSHAVDHLDEVLPPEAVGLTPRRYVTVPRAVLVTDRGVPVARLCADCVSEALESVYGLREIA